MFSFNRARLTYAAIGVAALAATELARGYYRPFIRERGINDFHIADTLGNSLGTVTMVFITMAVFGQGTRDDRRFLVIATVASFLYELGHPLLGRPIDPWDLLATMLAGLVSALIYTLLNQERRREAADATA